MFTSTFIYGLEACPLTVIFAVSRFCH